MITRDGKAFFEASDYLPIKKLYEKAWLDKSQSFMYEGHEIVTDYAKYLLEYMETQNKTGAQ